MPSSKCVCVCDRKVLEEVSDWKIPCEDAGLLKFPIRESCRSILKRSHLKQETIGFPLTRLLQYFHNVRSQIAAYPLRCDKNLFFPLVEAGLKSSTSDLNVFFFA